jgi:uncharacterized membrane protein
MQQFHFIVSVTIRKLLFIVTYLYNIKGTYIKVVFVLENRIFLLLQNCPNAVLIFVTSLSCRFIKSKSKIYYRRLSLNVDLRQLVSVGQG